MRRYTMVAEKGCECGDTSTLAAGRRRLVFPCAGTSNVGQISNTAALQLGDEGYGVPTCIALLGSGDVALKRRIEEADEVVIIDGCSAVCGAKIAASQGVNAARHLVITDLGIEKAYTREIDAEQVERVVSAIWEGKGRWVL
ncbi:MAG: putative zinc-binding protein [Methanomicrobiales archaeon]|nr:putative zinc-binding protein [Methanomicrobiales archaeon]